jgi:epoxide hydrolase-like predicted phosphatase
MSGVTDDAAVSGPAVDGPSPAERTPRGLIIDWGGVLTSPLDEAMSEWARRDGVDFAHFRTVMQGWVGASGPGPVASGGAFGDPAAAAGDERDAARGNQDAVVAEVEAASDSGPAGDSPVHRLERGEISDREFERELAAALRQQGSDTAEEGLLSRLLGGLVDLREDMLSVVRRARAGGLRTALLSNSWGDASYPEQAWAGAFDAVVISGRVGMRKPDIEIYRHTADLLELDPVECVMVDDLAHNIRGAAAAGMIGVLHRDYETTLQELEILFGRSLGRPRPGGVRP